TNLHCLEYVWDKIDMILIMSVNPGFGGQQFIPSTLNKLKKTRALIMESGKDVRLAIDGGIKVENIFDVAEAGADTFIVGSAIFTQPNYAKVLTDMRQELAR